VERLDGFDYGGATLVERAGPACFELLSRPASVIELMTTVRRGAGFKNLRDYIDTVAVRPSPNICGPSLSADPHPAKLG
jgi:hypothetical protein